MDVRPDPKPVTEGGIGRKKPDRGNRRRGRVTASRDGWLRLRKQKLGPCRVCMAAIIEDGRGVGELQLHHLVPRSLGGDDVADNLIPLHHFCHSGTHARNSEALRAIAGTLTDAESAYVVGKLGEGALERLFGVGRPAAERSEG